MASSRMRSGMIALGIVSVALVSAVTLYYLGTTVWWDVRLASSGKTPDDVACVLTRGGTEGRCQGVVIWREGARTFEKRLTNIWVSESIPHRVSITLSGGNPVDGSLLDGTWEARYRMKVNAVWLSYEFVADEEEWLVYLKKGRNTMDFIRIDPDVDPDEHSASASVFGALRARMWGFEEEPKQEQ
jgi:hypothetical protein